MCLANAIATYPKIYEYTTWESPTLFLRWLLCILGDLIKIDYHLGFVQNFSPTRVGAGNILLQSGQSWKQAYAKSFVFFPFCSCYATGAIPDEIGTMSKLEWLWLNKNSLRGEEDL